MINQVSGWLILLPLLIFMHCTEPNSHILHYKNIYEDRPVSRKLKYLRNVNGLQLNSIMQHPVGLKCTETYGTPSFEHLGCLNYTEFLNYENESVKYNLCWSHQCAICVDALSYQREPGKFLCECKLYTVIKSENKLKG